MIGKTGIGNNPMRRPNALGSCQSQTFSLVLTLIEGLQALSYARHRHISQCRVTESAMALSPPSPSGLRAPPLPLSRSSALLTHTERAVAASPLLPLDPSKTTIKHLLRGSSWITWRSRESSLKSCSHRFWSLAERLRIVSSPDPVQWTNGAVYAVMELFLCLVLVGTAMVQHESGC